MTFDGRTHVEPSPKVAHCRWSIVRPTGEIALMESHLLRPFARPIDAPFFLVYREILKQMIVWMKS